jgi:hypothetical protein
MQSAPVFDHHSGGKQSPKPEAAISPCGQNERPVWCDRRGERRDARGSIKNGTAREAGLMEASNRRAGDHRRGFQDDITTAFYSSALSASALLWRGGLGCGAGRRLFLRRVSTLGMQHHALASEPAARADTPRTPGQNSPSPSYTVLRRGRFLTRSATRSMR